MGHCEERLKDILLVSRKMVCLVGLQEATLSASV